MKIIISELAGYKKSRFPFHFLVCIILFATAVLVNAASSIQTISTQNINPVSFSALYQGAPGPQAGFGYWTRDNGTRVMGGSVPYVIALANGQYRMYYCNQNSSGIGISSAISSDGLNWTVESGVRLSPKGGQESIVCDPTVIRLSDGRYRMYYDGINQGGPYQNSQVTIQIYSAISTDGLNFQREGVRINSSNAVANGIAAVPEVVRTTDGRFRLYYVSNRILQPSYQDYMVSAVSNDGLNFTTEGPVLGLQPQRRDPAVILLKNNTYWMFFSCGQDGGCLPPGLFGAKSTDGRNFTVDSKPAAVYATSRGVVPVDPSVVLFPNNTLRMYYWYSCSCSTPQSIVSAYLKLQNLQQSTSTVSYLTTSITNTAASTITSLTTIISSPNVQNNQSTNSYIVVAIVILIALLAWYYLIIKKRKRI